LISNFGNLEVLILEYGLSKTQRLAKISSTGLGFTSAGRLMDY
jgi:hypothetical protein